MKALKNILAASGILVAITIIVMAAAPSVTVTYPNGGETVNGTVTVSADASDPDGNITSVAFEYSTNGADWTSIDTNNTANLTNYTVSWDTTVGVSDGTNYTIRATATDNSSDTDSDTSNTTFTVQNTISSPTAPNVTNVHITPDVTDATITFDVNQSDACTRVEYGTTSSLGTWSDWDNSTLYSIDLTGLTNGTTYYYSIYAHNASDTNYSSNTTINTFTTITPAYPNVTNVHVTPDVTDATITFDVNQSDACTRVEYGTTSSLGTWSDWDNSTLYSIDLTGLTNGTTYYYSIYAHNASDTNHSSNTTITTLTTNQPAPTITIPDSTPKDIESVEGTLTTFYIELDQIANISWTLDGNFQYINNSVKNSTFITTESTGIHAVTANASNNNGYVIQTWNWTVHPKFYNTGNRIWAADMNLNNTYTWTPQSFSGFFYDLDNDVSSETMTITLASKTNINIDDGKLVYESKPVNIKFEHDDWGNYTAIGFLAAKYFAGYTDSSVVEKKDMVSRGYLSKVLIDEDEKHTITIGSTLPLKEGYALKAIDISVEDTLVRFVLLKDGEEVSGSDEIVDKGNNYVYEKKIGSVSDVPIIIVYVETVFHGRETDAAFIHGVFQISENPTKIEDGDTYGIMEVKSKSGGIKMENDDSFDLSRDSTVEIMGNIKFKVADSDTLRFAPFVEGLEELRGTVSCSEGAFDWTPFNFEGLYYDFDTGFSSETLKVISASGSSIGKDDLVYESKPINTEFEHNDWGMYDLIGFMAEKYFAAYNNTNPAVSSNKDLLSKGYLSKVLIDEDEKHTITIGSTLPLKEGYALKAIDISVEDTLVRFVLLKDGEEVSGSDEIVDKGNNYVYEKKIGSVSDVPIIIVYVETVFHGRETDAAFIHGVFQISENPTKIENGDDYGKMEVKDRSNKIIMRNRESISLGAGDTIDVMGDIRFKVADSDTLRFYPYITVDVEAEAASKLGITAPDTASERDTITIRITAGGESIIGSDVEFNGEHIGITDVNGEVLYGLTNAGSFIINATKLGYESASKTITVEKYSETQLRIESESELLQTDTFELTVTVGETPLSGVDVFVDDSPAGVTDTDGLFSYMFDTSGTHTVKVEKEGYVAAEKTVNVIEPSAEFKAIAFNITPVNVAHKQPVFITADITNAGNIKGEHVVELRINGSVVASQNTTLEPDEVTTLNFTYTESEPGSYFAEIENMGGEFQVVKKSIGWLVYAGIITAIGLVVIYLVTMRRETIAPIIAPIGSKVVAAKDQLASKLSQLKTKVKK